MSRISKVTGTIAAGASLSGEIACGGLDVVGIQPDAAWDTQALSLQAGDGAAQGPAFTSAGEVTFAAVPASRYLAGNPILSGADVIRIRSGTQAAPVNQTDATTITVFLRG